MYVQYLLRVLNLLARGWLVYALSAAVLVEMFATSCLREQAQVDVGDIGRRVGDTDPCSFLPTYAALHLFRLHAPVAQQTIRRCVGQEDGASPVNQT